MYRHLLLLRLLLQWQFHVCQSNFVHRSNNAEHLVVQSSVLLATQALLFEEEVFHANNFRYSLPTWCTKALPLYLYRFIITCCL